MAGIISAVSDIVEALFVNGGTENGTAWVTSVINTVTNTPVLMLGILIGFSGLAVGMVKRLINIR